MEVAMAANFLAGTILVVLGLLVVIAGAVAINNLFARYWKPVKIASFYTTPSLIASPLVEETPSKQKSK